MRVLQLTAVSLLLLPLCGIVPPRRAERIATARTAGRPQWLKDAFRKAFDSYNSHTYEKADYLFQHLSQQSIELGDIEYAVRSLMNSGNCRLFLFRYQDALRAYAAARDLANSHGLDQYLPNLGTNMASVYLEMGDYRSASVSVEQALAVARRRAPGNLAYFLLQAAEVYARQSLRKPASDLYRAGLQEAYDTGDLRAAADGLDHWGGALLMFFGSPGEARRPLTEAFRLRKLAKDPNLRITAVKLARLEREEGNLPLASALFENVAGDIARYPSIVPPWCFYYQRGSLRLAQQREAEAWADFGRALEWADRWRLDLMPAEAIWASAGVRLAEVFQAYVETGLHLYRRSRNPALAKAVFEAAEKSRAWSLREVLRTGNQSGENREQITELLAQLRDAEAEALQSEGSTSRMRVLELRRRLIYLDSERNDGVLPRKNLVENNPTQSALHNIRDHLSEREALLTFYRTRKGFLRCSVIKSGLTLHEESAGGDEMRQAVTRFRSSILHHDRDRDQLGRELYLKLFGDLEPELARKTRWLLVLDDPLFELPFAALMSRTAKGEAHYLVEDHSLEILPGAWTLDSPRDARLSGPEFWAGQFVGIGDPIYNHADPRYGSRLSSLGTAGWIANAAGLQLTRLPSSRAEVERCALRWQAGHSLVLTGPAATRPNVAEALASRPAVLHFAAHVVHSPDSVLGSYLVLSIGPDGKSDLLGAHQISNLRGVCGLVVMNGCSSATGETLPGSGLMGLTRSWLLAGAHLVAATQWRAADDTGVFFEVFYTNLARKRDLGISAAADSLQLAQIAMLRSKSWRSDPSYWAAYFLIGRR